MHNSNARASWLLIELGGSSAQTVQQANDGRFWFTTGVVPPRERPVALACPGIVHDGRVRYATNLGWPEEADPRQILGIPTIEIVVNDAIAAALGESVLRTGPDPMPDLYYIALGTGVGSAAVRAGAACGFDLGHLLMGGTLYCEGCQNYGCLNSLLAARQLPAILADREYGFIAHQLATALHAKDIDQAQLLVLGGGIMRRHPRIKDRLAELIRNPLALTLAPPEAKSAAYAGLAYLVQHHARGVIA